MLEPLQSPAATGQALPVSPEPGTPPGPLEAAAGPGEQVGAPEGPGAAAEPGPEPPAGRSRAAAWRGEAAGPHAAWPGSADRAPGGAGGRRREAARRGADAAPREEGRGLRWHRRGGPAVPAYGSERRRRRWQRDPGRAAR